jgi:hypothetical protein
MVCTWTTTLFFDGTRSKYCVSIRIYIISNSANIFSFISDVGASELKPLFITGCCITALSLVLSLLSERWQFSHAKAVQKSRLNSVFAILSIGSAVGGSLGLILLSILDVVHYRPVHQVLLIVAMLVFSFKTLKY